MDLKPIRDRLVQGEVEAFLITHLVNVRYLSGFTGSFAALLISPQGALFITDPRYEEQSSQEVSSHFSKVILKPGQRLSQMIGEHGWRSLAVEDTLTLAQYNRLEEALGEVRLVTWSGVVEGLRRRKSPREIDKIRGAVELAQKAYMAVREEIQPGRVERDVALDMEFIMRRTGAQGGGFDFIVASGYRSALPHGSASSKEIQTGDLVILDFGARWEGYHSDMTRTLKVGGWSEWDREIYSLVLEAQEAALGAVKPGMKAQELDTLARRVIEKGGYGEFFGHGLGHGVGLEVHEAPSLSPSSQDILEEGMVFTLEPGIYLPGKGGVRVEDMIYLGSQGPEVLTNLEKER